MQFTATKKFNLIPIGQVRFSFKKRKGSIWVAELSIKHDTTMEIDAPTLKMVLKEMKKNHTDLLTDGTDFFTRTGESSITQVWHRSFAELLTAEENKEKIHELRFG